MTRRLSTTRNKVDRFSTMDRRRGYKTTTEQDVLCPHFNKRWLRLGKAPIVNDMVAVCHHPSADCDYRESFAGDFSLCHRYHKYDPFDFTLDEEINDEVEGNWQEADGVFLFERPFEDKFVEVECVMTQNIKQPVDMGNFMQEWVQFNERPNDKGDWRQNASKELFNAKNQGGRSAWFNPNHQKESNYKFSMRVQARGGDDDIYGCIFRYNSDTHSYYSIEWDKGGMRSNGVALVKNICTNPDKYGLSNLEYRNYNESVLARDNTRWVSNGIFQIDVLLNNERIIVDLYQVNGSNLTKLVTFDVIDEEDPLLYGSWGPMTWSQPDTYFWLLEMQKYTLIDGNVYDGLKKKFSLQREKIENNHRVLSLPIHSYFEKDILDALFYVGLTKEDVTKTEYIIRDHNVFESIFFNQYEHHPTISEMPEAKIVLPIEEDDYGHRIEYPFSFVVTERTDPDIIIKHIVEKDMRFIGVDIRLKRAAVTDQIQIRSGGENIYTRQHVISDKINLDLSDQKRHLQVNETVEVYYYPNQLSILFYESPYAIDTHQRIYMIKNRKHGWHNWNPYAVYEEEDEEE